MRPALTFAVLLAVTPVWADDDPEPPPAGNKELEGTRAMSSVRAKDLPVPIPEEAIKKMRLTFSKDKVKVITNQGEEKEQTVKLDASKKPKHIDMREKGARKAVLGIYKVEKGQLTICFKLKGEGKERPKGFDDDDAIIMVLTKVKK